MKIFGFNADSGIRYLEAKLGTAGMILLCGTLLLIFAALFTTPRWELYYHGKGFSRLSSAPFDFSGGSGLQYRILAPLLGYIFFMGGSMFKYFMLLVTIVFLGACYVLHRKKDFSPTQSIAISGLLALSTLTFFQLHFPAYTDPLSYLLILLLLFYFKTKWKAILIISLLLFNHDNTLFLMPFIFLLLLGNEYTTVNFMKKATWMILAFLPYLLYRIGVSSLDGNQFDADYYFNANNLKWTWDRVTEYFWLGVFQAFRLAWIFPLIALVINARNKNYHEISLILVCFVFVATQMFIAYDISRLMGLAFPVILLGIWRLKDVLSERQFNFSLWMVLIIQLFIPSYCIGALEPLQYPPFWWPALKQQILFLIN